MSKPVQQRGTNDPADPHAPSDPELVTLARDGDADAFAELVRRYQRRVVSVAYRLLGNREDASDVSQDAFVRAFRSLSQLEDASRFGAWLMKVVTNLSLNFRRARAARATAPLDDPDTAGASARDRRTGLRLSRGQAAAGGALHADLHHAVTRAIDGLPDKQRLALVLFSMEGLPQREVADILDCSVELVKWNVFQARKKLKEQLRDWL